MKAGDSSEFYYLTVLYCTPPNCNVICSMYIPCLLLTDKFCLSEFQKLLKGKNIFIDPKKR